MNDVELVRKHFARNKKLKANRALWEPLWDSAGQFVMSQTGSMLSSSERTHGEKRGIQLYDGTPEAAKDVMVAGFYSSLCPDNYQWYKWTILPLELGKLPEVKKWLSACEDASYMARNDSNWGDITLSAFEHLVSFGTSIKYGEYDPTKILNYQIIDLTTAVFVVDIYGKADTMYREFKLSARNALKRFKPGLLPDDVKRADESGNKDNEFNFLHVVCPREDYNPSKRDKLNMPFESLWLYADKETNPVLERGGYRNFPYTVTRMYRQGTEIYGRGPAIKALCDMGLGNKITLTNITAAEMMVTPALQQPEDGFNKAIDFTPGGMSYYNPQKGKIEPINTGINVPFGLEMQDRQDKAIQRWFHVDTFLMLSNSDMRITATEVLERKQEKLVLLGPLIGTQKREHFDVDLDRDFSIMYENGLFPPAPQIVLENMERMETEYLSPLFLAQMKQDSDAILETIQKTSLVAQSLGDPTILDNFDPDRIYEIIADRANQPAEVTRDPKDRDALRQQRAQKQQAMEQAQNGMAAVEAAKSLGQTPMDQESPNAMTELMKGMQGGEE